MPAIENIDRARTAVLSMDIQKATARRSAMFRERNVGQAAKSVLEAARKAGILVVHVVIDYQPAFFSPRNKFLHAGFIRPRSRRGRALASCR